MVMSDVWSCEPHSYANHAGRFPQLECFECLNSKEGTQNQLWWHAEYTHYYPSVSILCYNSIFRLQDKALLWSHDKLGPQPAMFNMGAQVEQVLFQKMNGLGFLALERTLMVKH